MKTEWIIVELIAIFIEASTKIYFLSNRFVSKHQSLLPQVFAWLCLFGWGVFATFTNLPPLLYDGTTYSIAFVYLLLTKHGGIGQKLFSLVLTLALAMGSSLIGAALASFISNVSVKHTLIYQDSARLLAIILIKTIQVILFYLLTKKHYDLRVLQKKPVIVLTFAAIMILLCLLFMFFNLTDFSEQTNHLLIWLSSGLLFALIGIFVMYEMFVQEEIRNIDLSAQLQRLEMESNHFRELDVMLSDLRTWRHEYKNNLVALRALIEDNANEKTLEYLLSR